MIFDPDNLAPWVESDTFAFRPIINQHSSIDNPCYDSSDARSQGVIVGVLATISFSRK
jgi:hypothetical protein